MAGRINTYNLIRKIHLYSALSLSVFIMMYFITGLIILNINWVSNEQPEPVEVSHNFSFPTDCEVNSLAKKIKKDYQVEGRLEYVQERDDQSIFLEFYHPGLMQTVELYPNQEKLVITTHKDSQVGIVNGLHRTHKYKGGLAYLLYAFILDITSLATIIFAITGVYLWFNMIKYKWLGWLIFSASIVYTAVVIALLLQ